ncbi:PH domain-containing protein [Modestobacter excelsi]|uniref:PH domain-containing protein n=1 Tax=Modestobacter excelsi TaxID=2213161 RepID=UPI00110C8E47|nr:PH domain-containing protein [Modestobacter excelsi]
MSAPTPVREPVWSLSRKAIALWVAQGAVGTLCYGLVVGAFWLLVPLDAGAAVAPARWAGAAFVLAYAVLTLAVRPRLRFRVHRWEVTGEAIYTLTGWLTRTWTLVPISRVQTVDVTRGLLQQLFGLATVAVLTASSQGTVRVPHLDLDVARHVADHVARRAEKTRDEAT